MPLKGIFIDNALSRTLLRIYKHFDTVPEAVKLVVPQFEG